MSLVRGAQVILDGVDWVVQSGERWVVLGPNGSGKTSLLRIASLWLHPTSGQVRVFGHQLGRTDVRRLRGRIGVASAGSADQLRPSLTALEVVMTGRYAALEPWWHTYDDADRTRAAELLDRMGVGARTAHGLGSLSSGERQRVLLARALMAEPDLVLLDEPTAGLDLPGREELVASLDDLAADPSTPPTVLVTHHVEEIPPCFTHALLLSAGRVQACGAIREVLTAEALSACMRMAVQLDRDPTSGRLSARARREPAGKARAGARASPAGS
nr:ATP-binding cassette domain-containing protein [Rhabdothermincola sediminis]